MTELQQVGLMLMFLPFIMGAFMLYLAIDSEKKRNNKEDIRQ
jgi:hypothetical protein